jgi:hypothetical protein
MSKSAARFAFAPAVKSARFAINEIRDTRTAKGEEIHWHCADCGAHLPDSQIHPIEATCDDCLIASNLRPRYINFDCQTVKATGRWTFED